MRDAELQEIVKQFIERCRSMSEHWFVSVDAVKSDDDVHEETDRDGVVEQFIQTGGDRLVKEVEKSHAQVLARIEKLLE